MRKLRFQQMFLAMMLLGMASASISGSERWIMAMNSARMVREQLIHVQFLGSDGVALESDALKQMVIREQDCSSGHVFEMAMDFKMGFDPDKKRLGIYLYPRAWKNKSICFSVPGIGKVEKTFTAVDNTGHSIQLHLVH